MSAVLKLVQAEAFKEEINLSADAISNDSHSLLGAFQYCSPWKGTLARYVIERFSKRGQVVLDPFCATGSTGLDAVMLGRHFVGCAQDHGLVKLARSRLFPADLAEVALRLQFVPFKRPVDIRGYTGAFPHFFDSDTFRELMNLKASLRSSTDGASEFISFIVASIIHGHTAAHLSAYSSPSEGLSPEAQAALNRKRNEVPSYRAVSARVLKKAALLLRDGVPSVLTTGDKVRREVFHAEPHDVTGAATGSVDLVLLAPDQPGVFEHGMHSWLRTWWLGVDVPEGGHTIATADQWRDMTNGILLEMARVVRAGGRVVVRTGQGRINGRTIHYARELEQLIANCLQRFWRIEGAIAERYTESSKVRSDRSSSVSGELVVLRRK